MNLSPEEFWSLTPKEFTWKYEGMKESIEDKFLESMISSYYSGYGIHSGKNGQNLKKFLDGFMSPERKIREHKRKIERIRRIHESYTD